MTGVQTCALPICFPVTIKPVCNSVELGNCSHDELINAYDNTIVYTDYLLSRVIDDLKSLKEYHCAMLYVSDHGESLGENNLYMHGVPLSLAPKEQYEIPFIVWESDNSRPLKGISYCSLRALAMVHNIAKNIHLDLKCLSQFVTVLNSEIVRTTN